MQKVLFNNKKLLKMLFVFSFNISTFFSDEKLFSIIPSQYLCTIDDLSIFSLQGWSPIIHAKFHVLRTTRKTFQQSN